MKEGFEKSPVLITGCARSGTSLVAGIINLCGAEGGDMFGATSSNRKGMFENKIIREQICKPFLRSIGADVLGQSPLPDMNNLQSFSGAFINTWRERVIRAIGRKEEDDKAWFYKGAKTCLMWPVWHSAFPKAKWIIVRRDTEKIIDSCLSTLFMKAYSTREGWRGWVQEHEKRFAEMRKNNLDVTEIWAQDIIDGDYSIIRQFVKENNLTWDESKVTDFISKDLWHFKSEKEGK